MNTTADLLSAGLAPAMLALAGMIVTACLVPALGLFVLVRFVHSAVEAA